jgi:hypothetical protein
VIRRDVMALIGAALGLSGCGSDTYTWRQKLTVSVNTPDGVKTGAAVTEVTANDGIIWLSGSRVSYSMKGEATVVELAPGKFLFAVLSMGGTSEPPTYELAARVWNDKLPEAIDGDVGPRFAFIEKLRESRPLTRDQFPGLITFADINDPKSVKEVKPGKFADVFGTGYSLSSITLEITDETPGAL